MHLSDPSWSLREKQTFFAAEFSFECYLTHCGKNTFSVKKYFQNYPKIVKRTKKISRGIALKNWIFGRKIEFFDIFIFATVCSFSPFELLKTSIWSFTETHLQTFVRHGGVWRTLETLSFGGRGAHHSGHPHSSANHAISRQPRGNRRFQVPRGGGVHQLGTRRSNRSIHRGGLFTGWSKYCIGSVLSTRNASTPHSGKPQ